MTAFRSEDATAEPAVQTGAARLAADGFGLLRGKRVGLLTNHTGRVGNERLVDVVANARGVRLAAILTPEHGLSGTAEAGAKVAGGRDARTGVRVLSLYGSTLKPTPAMLDGLDLLVFDMQDIGTRFYTFISTMGLAMQAAAAARLPFVVLDRPNPLGGERVSGYVLEKPFASFVGRYEIPITHGLTVGELARMIAGERLLPGLDSLALEVVPISGWRRDMLLPATRLPWVPTSPNIPTFETALAYAGTGLFEATAASEGRGTHSPFLQLGHPDIDAARIAADAGRKGLSGYRVEAMHMTPRTIAGLATGPRFRDQQIPAVKLTITNASTYAPVETGIHLLAAFAAALRSAGKGSLVVDAKAFGRLAGTQRLTDALARGTPASEIVGSWNGETRRFTERRAKYLSY
ncbi:MAG: exo-beta-N-acetylmuramidase NamZ domain-containing protein [Hyphomicrobiaceae bacterium]